MTENEAKTKWCPMVGKERIGRQNEFCIASDCALWRWTITPGQANIQNALDNCGAQATGYCGLGGKP